MAFKKYKLSESQLTQIARLCVQEQGYIAGVKAEASQAANLLETNALYRNKYGSDIYSFIFYASDERKNADKARYRKVSSLRSFFKYLEKVAHLIDSVVICTVDVVCNYIEIIRRDAPAAAVIREEITYFPVIIT